MWSTLVLLHNDESDRSKTEIPNFISWHTCMRSVYLSDERILNNDFLSNYKNEFQIYTGYEAYSFLIEIVCGLHSKLYGESEVQAQFRDRFSENHLNDTALSHLFKKLRDQILEHSKIIRTQLLNGIGRQSYGGLCEKYIHSHKSIHLFGTGKLAEALLPYLASGEREVTVYGRNLPRMNELSDKFKINLKSWDEFRANEYPVIIASSVFPENIMETLNVSALVLDFREDDGVAFRNKNKNYIPFSTLLSSIQITEENISLVKPKVHHMINDLTHSREEEQIHFMNGWEDLPQVCY
jgi:glutamyl-tRNA reductase